VSGDGVGEGQAGPSTVTSLIWGPFAAAGSVIATRARWARRPHATGPGSWRAGLVYVVSPDRVRLSPDSSRETPPSSRRRYDRRSRTVPGPSAVTRTEPSDPFQDRMPISVTVVRFGVGALETVGSGRDCPGGSAREGSGLEPGVEDGAGSEGGALVEAAEEGAVPEGFGAVLDGGPVGGETSAGVSGGARAVAGPWGNLPPDASSETATAATVATVTQRYAGRGAAARAAGSCPVRASGKRRASAVAGSAR